MQYQFRDLEPTPRKIFDDIPEEGFAFGDFDSRKADLFLLERTAKSPAEKEITDEVPYMQGMYDFSIYQNERFFSNREITYKLVALLDMYDNRKALEQIIKRQLMPLGTQTLQDTHEDVYYWTGKCKEVDVDDDAEKRILSVTITFDCYPFAFTNSLEGADIWDDIDFNHWIWQNVKYDVNGSQDIYLQNIGSHPITCNFEISGKITISGSFGKLELDSKVDDKTSIVLPVGVNKINLDGSGSIYFKFRREEMI